MRKFATEFFRSKWSAMLVLFCLFSVTVYGQNTVAGTIIDGDSGEPIVGANVVIKGTTIGTITDLNGSFSIQASGSETIVFSYIGYETQEVVVGAQSVIDVRMAVSADQLSEIVVTGYAVQDRANVTSAIASVDVKNMAKRTTADVTSALQGTVTGMQINYTDANPGSAFNINIRGVSSPLGASGSPPLVVVDGVQISGIQNRNYENIVGNNDGNVRTTGLENLNPNDIESIQVLKDASAAAIYGSRGANGVILVTTKRGKKGTPRLSYNASFGVQSPFNGPATANTGEYVKILQSMYGADLGGGPAENNPFLMPQAALDYVANPNQFDSYNWYDIVYDEAFQQSHDLSVSGGGDFGSYRISTGYKDQDGVALGTGYDRVNIRANSDFNVSKRIKIGQSIALSSSETSPEPYAFSRSVMYKAIAQVPYFSPYGVNPDPTNDPSKPPRNSSFYWGGGDNPEALIRNPLDYAEFWSESIKQRTVATSLYLEAEIVDGLKYKLSGSFNETQGSISSRTRALSQPQEYFNSEKSISEEELKESNWTVENILTYQKEFGKHNFSVLAGYIAQEFNQDRLFGSKEEFLSDITSTLDGPGANPSLTVLQGSETKRRLNSVIAQGFYSYDGRYTFNVSFRRDGSSSFDPSVRWGNFPGFSAGWTISNEAFWSDLRDAISTLKFRGGYGILGRQATGPYPPQSILSSVPYSFGGSVVNGLITPGPLNPFITWEESKTTNIGMDFGILDDKLTGSFEYFERKTDQLISALVIPASAGGGEIQTNDGEINNNGFEFELNWRQKVGPIDLTIGANTSYVKTVLTSIPEDLIFGDGAPEWDVPWVTQTFEGRAPAEFWLIKTDGIFRSQAEVDAHRSSDGTIIQPDAKPGDLRFVDFNDDGQITSDPVGGDRQFMGLGIAPWNAGLNINAAYKNFDVTFSFYGNFGSKVYNGPKYLLEQPYGFDNFSPNLLGAYDETSNPNSNLPRNNPNDINENWNSRPESDRYLEDGSFVKASLIQIGYNLPSTLFNKIGVRSARVSVSGQNLFTISGYDGIDPEQGRDGLISAGIDRGTAPQFRTFLLNFSLNF